MVETKANDVLVADLNDMVEIPNRSSEILGFKMVLPVELGSTDHIVDDAASARLVEPKIDDWEVLDVLDVVEEVDGIITAENAYVLAQIKTVMVLRYDDVVLEQLVA